VARAAGRPGRRARLDAAAAPAPGLAGLGLGIGLLAGFWLLLGFGLASPRQLFERLPGLALGALILGVPLAMTAARPVHVVALAAAALGVGWWMAGGPLPLEDMRRAAPVWMAVSLAATLLLLENGGRWHGLVAAALLAALLALAEAPGPWMLLGLCVLAATAGASAAFPALPAPARLAWRWPWWGLPWAARCWRAARRPTGSPRSARWPCC
jgi:hypothetical protein